MNRRILLVCIPVVLLIVLISIVTHVQSGQYNSEEKNTTDLLSDKPIEIDWQSALQVLPQYQSKQKSPQVVIEDKPVQISDSTIIAIVADKPRSILLITPNQQTPVQLTEGDGWLDSWIIQSILPDTVMWKNTNSNQTYQQSLFRNSPNDDKNLTSSKTGK
ncbi:hypothetical protein [Neptunicella sp.]|uniref:hypothetical protein n=1 Tax=Neptunicella sp. TaxID=2125986 RepID=UPI003F690F2D